MGFHNSKVAYPGIEGDYGFSCPSCGEYTETSPCEWCHATISQDGEEVFKDDIAERDNTHLLEILDKAKKRVNKLVEKKSILVNGVEYDYYGEKTENGKLIFFLRIGGHDIKVVCNPFAKNAILGIFKKGSSKTLFVPKEQFITIRTIIGMFKRNPEKYGLSGLQIFKH